MTNTNMSDIEKMIEDVIAYSYEGSSESASELASMAYQEFAKIHHGEFYNGV